MFGTLSTTSIAVMAFAIVFFAVGVYRVSEFAPLGLRKGRQRLLIALHLLGCGLLTAAFFVLALDVTATRRTLAFSLLVGALAVLAPGQFTIGMAHRRERDRERERTRQ
jgi:hypothetical protein